MSSTITEQPLREWNHRLLGCCDEGVGECKSNKLKMSPFNYLMKQAVVVIFVYAALYAIIILSLKF